MSRTSTVAKIGRLMQISASHCMLYISGPGR
jgi:hypothetical protein